MRATHVFLSFNVVVAQGSADTYTGPDIKDSETATCIVPNLRDGLQRCSVLIK